MEERVLYLSKDIPITLFRFFTYYYKYLFEGLIFIIIIYNIGVGLRELMAKDEITPPALYEGYTADVEERSERLAAIKKIKEFEFFNNKKNNIVNVDNYTGKIKLVGTIVYTNDIDSMVILNVDGEHKTYYAQDIIDNGTIAIVKVSYDHIIIKTNGLYYSLNIP